MNPFYPNEKDEPSPTLVEYALVVLAAHMRAHGTGEDVVSNYLQERRKVLSTMGANALATHLLHELWPEDYTLSAYGPN